VIGGQPLGPKLRPSPRGDELFLLVDEDLFAQSPESVVETLRFLELQPVATYFDVPRLANLHLMRAYGGQRFTWTDAGWPTYSLDAVGDLLFMYPTPTWVSSAEWSEDHTKPVVSPFIGIADFDRSAFRVGVALACVGLPLTAVAIGCLILGGL
jgi:hypothetical protein